MFVASSGATGQRVVLWSGPWGWALQPVAGNGTAASLLALGLLVSAAGVAIAAAARGFTPCPTERHAVRAEARSGAVASAWAIDARTARLSLRHAAGPAERGRATTCARRGEELAVPWRDGTSALRAPQRTLGCTALAAGAAAVAVVAADHPAAQILAALGAYVAASIMLEPLRQEIDQPSASRVLLLRPFGRILLGHIAVPIAVLATGTVLAGLGAAVAGALPSRGGAVAVAAVAVVPAIVLCAALSSRRGGRLPVSVLALGSAGDPSGGGIVIAWLLAWPAAAVVLGALPLVFVAHAHALGSALVLALAVAATAPFILAQVLGASEA